MASVGGIAIGVAAVVGRCAVVGAGRVARGSATLVCTGRLAVVVRGLRARSTARPESFAETVQRKRFSSLLLTLAVGARRPVHRCEARVRGARGGCGDEGDDVL